MISNPTAEEHPHLTELEILEVVLLHEGLSGHIQHGEQPTPGQVQGGQVQDGQVNRWSGEQVNR